MQVFSFSEELIAECIACFEQEDGIVLTPDQAQQTLSSLAGLYLAFAGGGEAAAVALAPQPPALYDSLIT